jgi:hypothetical protein
MPTILFISGPTMGDALGAIGRGFKPLFQQFGHELVEIMVGTPEGEGAFRECLQSGNVEFAFGFVGFGSDLTAANNKAETINLWQGFRIPYLSLCGDTPAYFFDRHVMPNPWCAILYAFPEHAELRARLPKRPAIIGVSPPGPMEPISKNDIDFRKKERGKLLFLKNGNDPEELVKSWKESLTGNMFLMLMEVAGDLVNSMGSDNGSNIDERVQAYFAGRGLDVKDAAKLRLFFIAQLDDYLRRVKSNLLAEVLMDFPIDMFGHNWEHLDFSKRRINFTPGGDYTRSGPMIRECLGMIDMSPNTDRAPHERPLRSFGSYTLCLTNRQSFFDENVKHADDFSFRFERDEIATKIADVIAHPKRYVEIGAEAAQDFSNKFNLSHFAELLLDTASTIRFMNGERPGPLQRYFAWPPMGV